MYRKRVLLLLHFMNSFCLGLLWQEILGVLPPWIPSRSSFVLEKILWWKERKKLEILIQILVQVLGQILVLIPVQTRPNSCPDYPPDGRPGSNPDLFRFPFRFPSRPVQNPVQTSVAVLYNEGGDGLGLEEDG